MMSENDAPSPAPAAVQLGFSLPLHRDDDDEDDGDDASSSSDRSGGGGRRSGELCHRSPRWSDWDGGKVGGVPSWLNPRDVPPSTPLRCRGPCSGSAAEGGGTIMRFVAQLYSPADDATGNVAAFHRSLYVFACPACCSSSGLASAGGGSRGGGGGESEDEKAGGATAPRSSTLLSRCVRVLRCQLPKENDFYPASGDADGGWTRHTSEHWAGAARDDGLNPCAVCGQRSGGRCPRQKLWFCGPDHQRECLRASKRQQKQRGGGGGSGGMPSFPSVCRESELVVEDEPAAAAAGRESAGQGGGGASAKKKGGDSALFPSQDITDDDADLEQSDLNALVTGSTSIAEAAAGVTDPRTIAFYARMSVGGSENDVRDQCLRYCRWPELGGGNGGDKSVDGAKNGDDDGEEGDAVGPLWVSSDNLPPMGSASVDSSDGKAAAFPPTCQYCGAPRAFEFQILPQMLHYLSSGAALDDGASGEPPRSVLTDSERAVLLEAKTKIESGMELPEGFKEQHDAAVAKARAALLGSSSTARGSASGGGGGGEGGASLDWGTIAVYTCTASCGDGGVAPGREEDGAYMEEAAWVQPPLD